ncbi:MAG: alcohol dehydrogenase catalytic domain-containing protein [Lentisphaeraceae bacterium]|nr:alcohol dehydrogenase catalytic domain-containing protein [Lentisphaeraceae bacterium]
MTAIKAFRLKSEDKITPDSGLSVTHNAEVAEIELPELQHGEILAQPLFTGVCGSDNSACLGKPNFSWVERPRVIGHECSAKVLQLGPGDHGNLKVGDYFTPVAMLGCRKESCEACSNSLWNHCSERNILGYHRDGAFAEKMILESARCVPFVDNLTPEQGALVEPLSVAVNAIYNKCNIKPGQDVVVSGCGIIGLLAAELAKASGARVAITGIEKDRDSRLKLAEERGFTPIIVSQEQGLHDILQEGVVDLKGQQFGNHGKIDLLIECSGVPQMLAAAGLSVKLGGDICVIATYPGTVALDGSLFTRSAHNMRGSMGSSKKDFEIAQKLLVQDLIPIDKYVTFYEFDDVMQAFEDSITAKTVKAVVKI